MLKSNIYIGENIYIPRDAILAILDSKALLKSKDGKEFIRKNKAKGFSHLSKGGVKSFIITSLEGEVKVYESSISSDSIGKKFKKKGLKNIDE